MIVGLAVVTTILYFNYSIAVEIKHYFQSSVNQYTIPIWISIGSAIGINFVGALAGLFFMKGLQDMVKDNKHQAQHQKATQYKSYPSI